MKSLWVVAHNTFRETVRDKILYNLVFFALLLIGLSVLLGTLTIGEQAKIVNDVGLAAINLVGVIIAIFVGIGLVSKEIERRTIYTILARPITRTQFILGKYGGLGCVMVVNLAIMVIMFFLTIVLTGNPVHGSLFQAIQLILVETLLVTAMAMFFSTFSSPTLSAIMTIGFYLIGHLTTDLKGIAEKKQESCVRGDHVRTLLCVPQPGVAEHQGPSRTWCHGGWRISVGSHGIRSHLRKLALVRRLPHF